MLGKPDSVPDRTPALNLARKAYLEAYAAIAAHLQSAKSALSAVPSSSPHSEGN